jgi:rRNA maturation endonuclease Nob1
VAKLNELLKAKLVFKREEKEGPHEDGLTGTQVVISTSYDGIYRQFAYVPHLTNLKGIPQDALQLEEEAKNIITQVIDKELSKKYVRCRSCWSHIMRQFEKSGTHKCEVCGEENEIKVLIDKDSIK